MTAAASPKDHEKERVVRWESHNQDQLDQQQRDGQEPVAISVSIVEWRTAEAHLEVAFRVGSHCEGINPRVEDTDIVVAGSGCHQASDGQCSAELLVDLGNLQPEEDGTALNQGVRRREVHVRTAMNDMTPYSWHLAPQDQSPP